MIHFVQNIEEIDNPISVARELNALYFKAQVQEVFKYLLYSKERVQELLKIDKKVDFIREYAFNEKFKKLVEENFSDIVEIMNIAKEYAMEQLKKEEENEE